MKLLANIILNLRATGPAAVVIVWIVGITALGLWGSGPEAKMALTALSIGGALLAGALASSSGPGGQGRPPA